MPLGRPIQRCFHRKYPSNERQTRIFAWMGFVSLYRRTQCSSSVHCLGRSNNGDETTTTRGSITTTGIRISRRRWLKCRRMTRIVKSTDKKWKRRNYSWLLKFREKPLLYKNPFYRQTQFAITKRMKMQATYKCHCYTMDWTGSLDMDSIRFQTLKWMRVKAGRSSLHTSINIRLNGNFNEIEAQCKKCDPRISR